MAEYIDRTNLITVTDIREDGSEFTYIPYSEIENAQAADVIERSKIDKTIKEIKAFYRDRPDSYNHQQRTEFYIKVLEIFKRNIGE